MTLPSSGSISMSQVNTELGLSSTARISLEDAAVRTLFERVGSGTTISMSHGLGKSNIFRFEINGGLAVNLRDAAIAAGWNGASEVIATNTGVIGSGFNDEPALTINGSFPRGVVLVNNYYIVGAGGRGGRGGDTAYTWGQTGRSGGTAISISTAIIISNQSVIAGGGGGGGGGYGAEQGYGGGGGGGAGYVAGAGGSARTYVGTDYYGNTTDYGYTVVHNGPGAAGSLTAGGGGGPGGYVGGYGNDRWGYGGGAGGALGTAGSGSQPGKNHNGTPNGGLAGYSIVGYSTYVTSFAGNAPLGPTT